MVSLKRMVMFLVRGNIKEFNTKATHQHSGKKLIIFKLAVIAWETANEHKVRNLENSRYLDPDSTHIIM
jgi:hypothetical protein